ncbi:MAG: rhodanese-like domain-containing protein [Bacteroidetes bacterium]|nr:rhodanese-like domain-containing protein [Bacteroidota bacterium]MCW5895949.1 rhodanese-like domain-containing protein [Bacteroidota bacterium]
METTGISKLTLTVREAIIIILASTVLGFSYSYIMKKGLFLPPVPLIAAPQAVVPPEFVSYEEALKLFNEGKAIFADARHEYDFKLGHIPGAVNVPLKDFILQTSPLANTPEDRLIITYCDGEDCNSSIELAQKLSEAGFTKVRMFFGGWNEWQQHNLSTER